MVINCFVLLFSLFSTTSVHYRLWTQASESCQDSWRTKVSQTMCSLPGSVAFSTGDKRMVFRYFIQIAIQLRYYVPQSSYPYTYHFCFYIPHSFIIAVVIHWREPLDHQGRDYRNPFLCYLPEYTQCLDFSPPIDTLSG